MEQLQKLFQVENPFAIVEDITHFEEVKNQNESFALYQRAHHVCVESKRVLQFNQICADDSISDHEKCLKLG